jgi:8-oxo-dGTP pyrophosphatase MutT (NUDIX family)
VTESSVRRRLIGAALRRCREEAGYTLDEPARLLDCDPYSLTAPSDTGQLTTQELTSAGGVIDDNQLWESVYGIL